MEGVFSMLRFLGFRKWKVVLFLLCTVGGLILAFAENGFSPSRTWDDLSGAFSGTPTATATPASPYLEPAHVTIARLGGKAVPPPTLTPTRTPVRKYYVTPLPPRPTRTPMPPPTPTPEPPKRSGIYGTPPPHSTATPIPTGRSTKGYINHIPLSPRVMERLVIEYTNAERSAHGLSPLIADPAISEIALGHSKHMASRNAVEHDLNGMGPTDRAIAAGYGCRESKDDGTRLFGFSENIAEQRRVWVWSGIPGQFHSFIPVEYSVDDDAAAKRLVARWMDSPGHRKNILDADNQRIGVGIKVVISLKYGYFQETVWATQNFSPCAE